MAARSSVTTSTFINRPPGLLPGPTRGVARQETHSRCLAGRGGTREVCLGFEAPLTVGTEYGAPAGQHSGDVIFTTNGIPVSVYDFNFAGGGGTFGLAKVDVAPFASGQSMRTNNINLELDFGHIGFVPAAVRFEFLDLGGVENISVNGSPIFAGDISAAPGSLGGATVSVSTTPVTSR